MKKLSLLIAALFMLITAGNNLKAQQLCSSNEYLQKLLAENPEMAANMQRLEQFTEQFAKDIDRQAQKTTSPIYTIPVVVHVLYNNSTANITDAQVLSQITALNNSFQMMNDLSGVPSAFTNLTSDAQIQFCMAKLDPNGNTTTGIIRVATTKSTFTYTTNDAKYTSLGGSDAWPRDNYLNIWVVPDFTEATAYAQFPGGPAATDGIVIEHQVFGTTGTVSAPFNKGQICCHEVGHWLNLRHIWGDDGNACTGSDFVDDTPNQGGPSAGCPSFPQLSCVGGKGKKQSDGDLFVNFMDYANCICMFTHGQKTRMHAVLAEGGPRHSLLSSQACQENVSCGAPQNLAAVVTSANAIVSWSPVFGALGYAIEWKETAAATWSAPIPVSSTSYTLSPLTSNVSYDYRITVWCDENTSYTSGSTFNTLPLCSDNYESNNSANSAAQIPVNTMITAQISSTSDKDYFVFNNTTATPRFKVSLTNLPADYDLVVYKSNKKTVAGASQIRGIGSETVIYNTNTVGSYYVYVSGYQGANNQQCYNLTVELSATNFYEESTFSIAEAPEQKLSFYPNPAQNELHFRYMAEYEEDAVIVITDQAGRTCKTYNAQMQAGINAQTIDVGNIPAGLYFVRFSCGETSTVSKVTIK